MSVNGNIVDYVIEGSPADRAGIRSGDVILSINRKKIRDMIDLMYYSDEGVLDIRVRRKKRVQKISVIKEEMQDLGIVLRPFKIKRCKNRCIFCFVNQLPKGLRKTLYIKDEDYRMSFLFGNYITLSNLTDEDRKRIVQQRLSPLYISVHSTDHRVRTELLRNRNLTDIMDELKWLTDNRIRIHAQVVLCPGYNDGDNLINTIKDLHRFYPYVMSVAVVPVGLTRFVKTDIRGLNRDDALRAVKIVNGFQRRFFKRYGDAFVHGADELYIKAEKRFPPLKYYGDFPQIENGVGMVPLFLHKAKNVSPPRLRRRARFVTFTATSFYPFLKGFIERLKETVTIDLIEVKNNFFGEEVTVAGLLTGRDIIRSMVDIASGYDFILMPDVVLRETGDLLLDDVSVEDIEHILGRPVRVFDSTPDGLLNTLEVIDDD
ncbi:MAG TPA: DUF512 domain-containing protein [Nitrospirae bacterium]|nr:DUF512 domain-containing protein [Nitrospirota bacterium]